MAAAENNSQVENVVQPVQQVVEPASENNTPEIVAQQVHQEVPPMPQVVAPPAMEPAQQTQLVSVAPPMQQPMANMVSVTAPAPGQTKLTHDTGAPEGFEVFVGRMPLTTTEQILSELAAPFNPIEVRVLAKPDRSSHLCGFVVFNEINKAQGFIAGFNGRLALGGNYPLNVRFADGKSRKKCFIGGLAVGTREEDVRSITQRFGTILAIKILAKNQKAPCGFVTFATGEQAEACIRELNNTPNADDTKNYVVKLAKAPDVGKDEQNQQNGKGQGKGMKRSFDNSGKGGGKGKGQPFKKARHNPHAGYPGFNQAAFDAGFASASTTASPNFPSSPQFPAYILILTKIFFKLSKVNS